MAVSWKRLLVLFCAVMLCLILCSSIDVGGDHLQLQGWGWGKKKGHKHKKYNHKKHKKHKKHKHKEHEHEEYEHEEHEHKKLKRKKIKFRLPLFRRKKSKGSYSMSPKKKRSRFNLLHKIRRHLKGKRKKRHKYKRKHYDTEDDDDYRAMDEMDEMEGGRNKRLSKNQLQGLKKAKGLIKKLTMGKHDKKVLEREMAKAAHSSGADTVKHLKKAESIMEKDENYDPWPRVNHTLHELILKVQ